MYQRQQAGWGFVPNYAKVFCHRPEIMSSWADLQRGIRRHVDPRRFELVTLAAAHALRNSYCSLAHGEKLTEYFSEEEVRAMVSDDAERVESLTAAEVAMMQYARKVAKDATKVTAGDVARLRSLGFSDAEIFDIAAVAAARAFFTKILEGLGAEPDSSFLEMGEGLRNALTPGGPIDFRETEVLPPARVAAVS
jgi:uncharacterized peroxidase-related enzyme